MSASARDRDTDDEESLEALTARILENGTATEDGERVVRALHRHAKREGK
ncbi:hypothetical protein HLRTI_002170 [Halorhabdus tiamatea SARL4B]|uniref:Uncharacterized protein n=1 Tax=Halorhabdus tiamatea SARL4B TaxID=1033806 RepID=U2DIL7_9EURY|nr:hypothetical protein [Halorhabdus tiamatea]ERJ05782.1 hypothetical protein HLRTI_002170 [Halorhabdus tiamatea SARL4B]